MKIFLLMFLATYGGMHILVFWGFYPLLKGHPALPTLTWIWMAGMIATPLLVRFSERVGLEIFARGLAKSAESFSAWSGNGGCSVVCRHCRQLLRAL